MSHHLFGIVSLTDLERMEAGMLALCYAMHECTHARFWCWHFNKLS